MAGIAHCWGVDNHGRLGDGSTTDSITPVQVIGLNDITAITAGWRHTCALTGDGTAHCWGNNEDRQLGDGTTTGRSTPVQVTGL